MGKGGHKDKRRGKSGRGQGRKRAGAGRGGESRRGNNKGNKCGERRRGEARRGTEGTGAMLARRGQARMLGMWGGRGERGGEQPRERRPSCAKLPRLQKQRRSRHTLWDTRRHAGNAGPTIPMVCIRLHGTTQTRCITSYWHVGAFSRKSFDNLCIRPSALQACTLQTCRACKQTTRIRNSHHERTACRDGDVVALATMFAAF